MFSGIVEETGAIVEIRPDEQAIRLRVRARAAAAGVKRGDSIAVNGCCLTVVGHAPDGTLDFDLLRETWDRTSFSQAAPGALVNLERSLPADGRIHGHFVTGHIDGAGTVETFEKRGADWYLRVVPPPELMRYVVGKGAIAVDGISLTVAAVEPASFAIWIIPHTWAVTALRERQPGSLVNLEADLLAKYVERLIRPAQGAA